MVVRAEGRILLDAGTRIDGRGTFETFTGILLGDGTRDWFVELDTDGVARFMLGPGPTSASTSMWFPAALGYVLGSSPTDRQGVFVVDDVCGMRALQREVEPSP